MKYSEKVANKNLIKILNDINDQLTICINQEVEEQMKETKNKLTKNIEKDEEPLKKAKEEVKKLKTKC